MAVCATSADLAAIQSFHTFFDTPGTLSGHFLDTPEPGARRARGTFRGTLPRTPPFSGDTLGDTPGTLRARRARETPVAGRGFPKPKVIEVAHIAQRQCLF